MPRGDWGFASLSHQPPDARRLSPFCHSPRLRFVLPPSAEEPTGAETTSPAFLAAALAAADLFDGSPWNTRGLRQFSLPGLPLCRWRWAARAALPLSGRRRGCVGGGLSEFVVLGDRPAQRNADWIGPAGDEDFDVAVSHLADGGLELADMSGSPWCSRNSLPKVWALIITSAWPSTQVIPVTWVNLVMSNEGGRVSTTLGPVSIIGGFSGARTASDPRCPWCTRPAPPSTAASAGPVSPWHQRRAATGLQPAWSRSGRWTWGPG